jgi:hypothetical protein
MATLAWNLARRLASLARQNPGNVRDLAVWIRRQLTTRPAPPNANAGNAIVVAEDALDNASAIRRWLWYLGALGGGLLGCGAIFWLMRRDGGEAAEIGDAVAENAGGAGGGDGGNGGGGIDHGFLLSSPRT